LELDSRFSKKQRSDQTTGCCGLSIDKPKLIDQKLPASSIDFWCAVLNGFGRCSLLLLPPHHLMNWQGRQTMACTASLATGTEHGL
jgi:hypothetical protein